MLRLDEIVATARTGAELGAFRGVRLDPFVAHGVAEQGAEEGQALVHGPRPDARIEQVRPEGLHVGPPNVPHLPALKRRQSGAGSGCRGSP